MYVGKTLDNPPSDFINLIKSRKARDLQYMPVLEPNDLAQEARTLASSSQHTKRYKSQVTRHEKEIITNVYRRLHEQEEQDRVSQACFQSHLVQRMMNRRQLGRKKAPVKKLVKKADTILTTETSFFERKNYASVNRSQDKPVKLTSRQEHTAKD